MFDSELKRAGGRAACPLARAPLRSSVAGLPRRGTGGGPVHRVIHKGAVKFALAFFPADLSNRRGRDFGSAHASGDGSLAAGFLEHRVVRRPSGVVRSACASDYPHAICALASSRVKRSSATEPTLLDTAR